MPLTETEAAYIAGIIDGEGSISLVRSHAKRTRGRYIYPVVRVANTSEALMLWLKGRLGGEIRYETRMNSRCKPCYHLQWAVGDAIRLLQEIRKFLVIKQAHADLVLDLFATTERLREQAGGYFGNGHPLPPELVSHREAAFTQLALLNRRGA